MSGKIGLTDFTCQMREAVSLTLRACSGANPAVRVESRDERPIARLFVSRALQHALCTVVRFADFLGFVCAVSTRQKRRRVKFCVYSGFLLYFCFSPFCQMLNEHVVWFSDG